MPNKNNTAKSVKKDATVKIMALGGLDEDGKNMLVVEAGEDIYIIEAGLKFPDASQSLGIEYIIQDFSWFQDKKDRVKAIFITHGHDDVMGALPHLLRQVRADIYTAPLAAREISRMLKKEKISGVKIHKINRHDSKRISGRKISFFPVTQSYPGAYGLAISTSQGYVVYSGEFVENFDDLLSGVERSLSESAIPAENIFRRDSERLFSYRRNQNWRIKSPLLSFYRSGLFFIY